MYETLTLLVPDIDDVERDAVARAWHAGGGVVMRLGRFWEPPSVAPAAVRLYGGTVFCEVVAQKLGLELLSPPDDVLLVLPAELLRRTIRGDRLSSLASGAVPCFVKPLVSKIFRGAVYGTLDDLAAETEGLAGDTVVLVADVVPFTAEARAFVLDGEVTTWALYEGAANTSSLPSFLRTVVAAIDGPRTYVVDVGFVDGAGWAVVETNPTWGAGCNGCEAAPIASCLAHAVRPSVRPSGAVEP